MNLLSGTGEKDDVPKVRIVDTGHQRHRELVIEVPGQPLEAVMSAEAWLSVYDQLQQLIEAHRTTLVFVNTPPHGRARGPRALRTARRDGGHRASRQHGERASPRRASSVLKFGQLRALVATASLESSASTSAMSTWSANWARHVRSPACYSGSGAPATPSARRRRATFSPLSRDELVECSALFDSVRRGELDKLEVTGETDGCAGPADRRRNRRPGLDRGRPLQSIYPGLSLSRSDPRRVQRSAEDAGGGFHHAPGPPRRADPLGHDQSRDPR